MSERIRNVVILGGGTAGWMTACHLARSLQGTVTVTVLEAPSVPRIGVGEATVPNLHPVFFEHLGVAEDEWMRECNASFKMAVKFVNWRTPGAGGASARDLNGRPDHFYHPFGILPTVDGLPLSHYWLAARASGETELPYDYSCFVEPPLMDAKLAPRYPDGSRATRYAWHFDAQLVADFLCRHATTKLGVVHIQDEMRSARVDERGFITELTTASERTIAGDLFVDCSGFRSLLMNQVMAEPFLDMSDHLLCDSAVATAVPHDDARFGVEPFTSAIAMPAGWTWKIPMPGRFGTGYVYSSTFANRDEAASDLARLWQLDPDTTCFNHIRFRVGRNRRAWVRNCVGIGLSSCFLEPLESTGIYFICAAIHQLARHFPTNDFDQRLIDSYNREIEAMFDDTRDFIQAHFFYAPRQDTPFWRANKELHLTEEIREKIERYRAGLVVNPPISDETHYYRNFEAEFRNFWTNGSYYCILAGLGVLPINPPPILKHKPHATRQAELQLAELHSKQKDLLKRLPTAHEYLTQLHAQH